MPDAEYPARGFRVRIERGGQERKMTSEKETVSSFALYSREKIHAAVPHTCKKRYR